MVKIMAVRLSWFELFDIMGSPCLSERADVCMMFSHGLYNVRSHYTFTE